MWPKRRNNNRRKQKGAAENKRKNASGGVPVPAEQRAAAFIAAHGREIPDTPFSGFSSARLCGGFALRVHRAAEESLTKYTQKRRVRNPIVSSETSKHRRTNV